MARAGRPSDRLSQRAFAPAPPGAPSAPTAEGCAGRPPVVGSASSARGARPTTLA